MELLRQVLLSSGFSPTDHENDHDVGKCFGGFKSSEFFPERSFPKPKESLFLIFHLKPRLAKAMPSTTP